MEELQLYKAKENTEIEYFPDMKKVINNYASFKNIFLPLLSIDGGIINEGWKGKIFSFIYQNVFISRLDFKYGQQKYTLLNPVELKEIEELSEIDVQNMHLNNNKIIDEQLIWKKTEFFDNGNRLIRETIGLLNSSEFEYQKCGDFTLPIKLIRPYCMSNSTINLSNINYEYNKDGFLIKKTTSQESQEVSICQKFEYKKAKNRIIITDHNYDNWSMNICKIDDLWKIEIGDEKFEMDGDFSLSDVVVEYAVMSFHKTHYELLWTECWDKIKKQRTIYNNNTMDNESKKYYVLNIEYDDIAETPDLINYTFKTKGKNQSIYKYTYSNITDNSMTIEETINERNIQYKITKTLDSYKIEEIKNSGSELYTIKSRKSFQEIIVMFFSGKPLFSENYSRTYGYDYYNKRYKNAPFYKFKYYDDKSRDVFEINQNNPKPIVNLKMNKPSWLQCNETPNDPDGNPMEFVGQLEGNDFFGTLFLFYSEKHNLISQIFQCT